MFGDRVEIGLSWLAGQRLAMQRLLERLVRQSSFSHDGPGATSVALMVETELRRIGLRTERIPSSPFGDHLYFETPSRDPHVFLVGHTDTVFPRRTFEGFELRGDFAHGPGVYDMKGGLVIAVFALEAFARAAVLRHVPLRGIFVSDEEIGSPGSQRHIAERAAGASCALVLEAGRTGDAIVTSRKGVGALNVTVTGTAAHAGNEHHLGHSAVWSIARFVDRAQTLTDPEKGITVNVGLLQGGTTRNTVPDRATAEIDVRFVRTEDGHHLVEQFEALAEEVAVAGTRIEVARTSWRSPMVRTEAAAALAREYGECQSESGLGAGEAPLSGGGSDACTTSAMGIPTIDGLGPRGSGYHTAAERADLTSFVPKATALVRFLGRRCR